MMDNKSIKIYIPTIWKDLINPLIIPFVILCLVLVDFFSVYNLSYNNIYSYLRINCGFLFLYFLGWIVSYVASIVMSESIFISSDVLYFCRNRKIKQYPLDSIKHFNIINAQSQSSPVVAKTYFTIWYKEEEYQFIYRDIASNLEKKWRRFGKKLQIISGKKVEFMNRVLMPDDKLMEPSEFFKHLRK